MRPRQSGRRAGQDEAFPVTGSAAATHRREGVHQYLLAVLIEAPLRPDACWTSHSVPELSN